MRFSRGVTRRQVAAGSGAAALSLTAPPRSAVAAKKAASITIVINQSPWFDSFRRTVELYEKENGNKVELDVNPFAGSLQNGAGSIRSPDHEQRLVYRNVFGGFVEAVTGIDPGFKLDSDIYTLDNTVYFDVPPRRRLRFKVRTRRAQCASKPALTAHHVHHAETPQAIGRTSEN